MPLPRATRKKVREMDRIYKKVDKEWSACPNCAGIFINVCTNGCHLSDATMQRFASIMNAYKEARP